MNSLKLLLPNFLSVMNSLTFRNAKYFAPNPEKTTSLRYFISPMIYCSTNIQYYNNFLTEEAFLQRGIKYYWIFSCWYRYIIAWFWWWDTVGMLINTFLWNYLQWNECLSAMNMDITFLLGWITFLWAWDRWCRDKKGCGLAHVCWVHGPWTTLPVTRTMYFF